MKILILLGMMVVGAGAQTAKPVAKPANTAAPDSSGIFTACDREGDKDCLLVIGTTTDVHGCQEWSGFTWDEGSQTCRTSLTVFKQPEVVTCSPLGPPDADGAQRAVCWYKPKGAKP